MDKDFIADDLKGHCRGLSKAFNPKANFVCCRENPKTMEPNKLPAESQLVIDAGYSEETEIGGNKSRYAKYFFFSYVLDYIGCL